MLEDHIFLLKHTKNYTVNTEPINSAKDYAKMEKYKKVTRNVSSLQKEKKSTISNITEG